MHPGCALPLHPAALKAGASQASVPSPALSYVCSCRPCPCPRGLSSTGPCEKVHAPTPGTPAAAGAVPWAFSITDRGQDLFRCHQQEVQLPNTCPPTGGQGQKWAKCPGVFCSHGRLSSHRLPPPAPRRCSWAATRPPAAASPPGMDAATAQALYFDVLIRCGRWQGQGGVRRPPHLSRPNPLHWALQPDPARSSD